MPLKDHLNKLDYFCAVVDCKSILKASYRVGISQPQISRVVKQLEEDLGQALLVRTRTGVEPTKQGLELYTCAMEVLRSVTNTETQIKNGKVNIQGEVRVGTYDSIARYFFPSFLKYLKASMPDLQVHLEASRSAKIFQRVQKGSLDIGICVSPENRKFRGLIQQDIYTDAFGFYHHPATSIEFMDQLIIFPESLGLTDEGLAGFTKKYKFHSSLLSDNLETVKSLSEESVGVALLPHRVAREAVLQGKLIPLKRLSQVDDLCSHRVTLCRKTQKNSEVLDSVVDELTRFLSSWSKT